MYSQSWTMQGKAGCIWYQTPLGVQPTSFSNPAVYEGAATNPDFQVLTYAGTQVKNAIDATIALGGENYVFGEDAKAICLC